MDDFKDVAISAARVAGTILDKHFPGASGAGCPAGPEGAAGASKDADLRVMTEERRAEAVIVKAIQGAFPDHAVLTEESGWQPRRGSPYLWIIDPLDGTINYAHRVPAFSVSIALEEEGRIVLGVVYDPIRRDMFVGVAGQGAWRNDVPIRVSDTHDLDGALLATGFAYDIRGCREEDSGHFTNFASKAQGLRRTGVVSMDLCYVAAGRFDGFWERQLDPWDSAAASLIVAEAGGMVTDYQGAPFSIYGAELLASNGRIHSAMQMVLSGTSERRAFRRTEVKMAITYQSGEEFKADYTRNLSEGGLYVQLSTPLPIGTNLQVDLALPSLQQTIKIQGVVVWAQNPSRGGRGVPGMGIQFLAMEPGDREVIGRLVASVEMASLKT
jgi:myo-inositol-1(or 4)-monophosphatase